MPGLFDDLAMPEGLRDAQGFLSEAEESALLARFSTLEFGEMTMRGVMARRRVIEYGWHNSFESVRMTEAAPIPAFLRPSAIGPRRSRTSTPAACRRGCCSSTRPARQSAGPRCAGVRGGGRDFAWRGVPLPLSPRPHARLWETFELDLQPRSIYVLEGPARSEWEHGIPAVKSLRYSITFGRCGRRADAFLDDCRQVHGRVSEFVIRHSCSALCMPCRAFSSSVPAGTRRVAWMVNPVNRVTRSSRSRVPPTAHSSDVHGSFEAVATDRNVRMKHSATAPTSRAYGVHWSPGPPNSTGEAVTSRGNPALVQDDMVGVGATGRGDGVVMGNGCMVPCRGAEQGTHQR